MANENHGSPAEEASLMSHSPGTSNQNQPSSPKPMRLVQDLPGTDSAIGKAQCGVLQGPDRRGEKVKRGCQGRLGMMHISECTVTVMGTRRAGLLFGAAFVLTSSLYSQMSWCRLAGRSAGASGRIALTTSIASLTSLCGKCLFWDNTTSL